MNSKVNYNILIIDDDKKVCDLFVAFVKIAYPNISCVTASDVNQGMMKLENQSFDLIFVDKVLPGKSGIEFIKNLRKSLRHSGKKVVLMSGAMERVDVFRVIHLGACDVMVKPFNFNQIKERLGKLLSIET